MTTSISSTRSEVEPLPNNESPLHEKEIDYSFSQAASKAQVLGAFILLGLTITAVITAVASLVSGIVAACLMSVQILALGAIIGASVGVVAALIAIALINSRRYIEPTEPLDRFQEEDFIEADSVYVSKSCEETNALKIELARHAKSSIQLSGSFIGGKCFRDFLDATLEAFEKNKTEGRFLEARLIGSGALLEDLDHEKLEAVKAIMGEHFQCLITHVKVNVFDKPGDWFFPFDTVEIHGKLLIIDGNSEQAKICLGGTNQQESLSRSIAPTAPESTCFQRFLSNWWTGCAVDGDIVFQSKALAQVFHKGFENLWKSWSFQMGVEPVAQDFSGDISSPCPLLDSKEGLVKNVPLKPLFSSMNQGNTITPEIIHCIKNAKETIHVASMVFNLQPGVREALIDAAARGVKIRVITNGEHDKAAESIKGFDKSHFCHYLPLMLGKTEVDKSLPLETLKALENVEIGHYILNNGMLHKKIWVFDKKDLIYNNGNNSNKANRDWECAARLTNEEVAKQTIAQLDKDWEECEVVTLEQAYNGFDTFSARLQSGLFSSFAP